VHDLEARDLVPDEADEAASPLLSIGNDVDPCLFLFPDSGLCGLF